MSIKFIIDGMPQSVDLIHRRPCLKLRMGDEERSIQKVKRDGHRRSIEIDGQSHDYVAVRDGNAVYIRIAGRTSKIIWVDPRDQGQASGTGSNEVRAPMPGAIVKVAVNAGDPVKAGDTLLMIESMKLLTNLVAPRDGIISAVLKGINDTFDKDEVLVALKTESVE